MSKLLFWQRPQTPTRCALNGEKAQAFAEYILVFALVALLFGSVASTWKGPLAYYLNRIAQAVAKTR